MIEISKAVIESNGKYLLLKRAPQSKSFKNTWDFPGGKHNIGESSLDAVIRETKEETNLNLIVDKKTSQKPYKDLEYDLLFHYYIPLEIKGELRISSHHTEYNWFSKEEIEKLDLHPSVSLYFSLN